MSELVRLLEADPDLGRGLAPEQFETAGRELVATTLEVPRGRWDPTAQWAESDAQLGLLIVEGILLSEVSVGSRTSLEVLGPGDVVRPWPSDRHAPELDVHLRLTAPDGARLAVLDRHFIAQAQRWPSVLGQIAERAMGRTSSATLRLLIQQVVRIDERLLLALWGLAERFGKVTPGGVLVPVALNHTMLAGLVGAHRPSVSHALSDLTQRGALERVEGGGWLLHGEFSPVALGGAVHA
ncbi:MAG TPA: helix-turn-helix domain-containing protein [Baekduia sp.]|uniref:helix-turn-helix domain-containing protein n=1 Tax=Baekduia sp. TaxID=2600305 RepID=UPI002B8EDD4D|nr:helix-turn-helix domain-containing protein [Baekduia sp.]HMJ34211.1 helix-turn-helix domain-containing protein [Baekduia sp.]